MKDYYLLLGINKTADKSEIKKAYRDSVKKYHPDGSEATGDSKRFREITEAYETLSDNSKRQKYDEKRVKNIPASPLGGTEPLKPGFSHLQRGYDPNPYIRDTTDDLPFRFFGRDSISQKTLTCEIHLTPEETQNDVQYPYTINIIKPCPHCSSLFSEFIFFCHYCNGSRYCKTKKELVISIPKGIQNGRCVHLDLEHVGLSEARLRVKVFVS